MRSKSEEEFSTPLPIKEPTILNSHLHLQKCISIAVEGHKNQIDESGHTYILHPLRVMSQFRDPYYMMVAVLHDLLEDTNYTELNLRSYNIPEIVIDAVVAITKTKDETYDQYIDKVLKNKIAIAVKIADIEDNGSFNRNWGCPAGYSEFYLKRLQRYRKTWSRLHGFKESNNN